MYMHECTLSLISSSSELLFSSSSDNWLGPTTVKWFKPSKNTKTKNLWQLKHGMRCIFSLNYKHVHVWFHFWKFQGEGVSTEIPRGVRWGNTCMDIPPPKEKIIYITYTFLAAHEYKLLLGYKNRIKRISYTIHENHFK